MTTELTVELFDSEADAEELDALTDSLRRELLELDVDSVRPVVRGEAPEGSKGLDVAAIGAVIVALKGSVELATQVVTAIRSWLGRSSSVQSARSLKLTMNGQTLELTNASAEEQTKLIDAWVAAATRSS